MDCRYHAARLAWILGTGKLPDVTTGYNWELYNIAKDYSEYNDLAAKMPDKLKEMQALFLTEAAKYQVFPLDNSGFLRLLTPRPSATAGKTVLPTRVRISVFPSVMPQHFRQRLHHHRRGDGSQRRSGRNDRDLGGRFGGYGLYLLKGKPVFDYNLLDLERLRWEGGLRPRHVGRALKPGKHTIVFDFKYDGPGPAKAAPACFRWMAGSWPAKHRAHDSVAHVH